MIVLLLVPLGCLPDDVSTPGTYTNVASAPTATDTGGDSETDTDTDTDSDTDTHTDGSDVSLVGSWRSEGDDLSELLAPYFLSVSATFSAAGDYVVVATDVHGKDLNFEGTYTKDEGTDPAAIELVQTSPSNATSDGIYAIDGKVLTYEVTQVVPAAGYTAPTPTSGFGSSSGPQLSAGQNVQTYRRQ